MERLHKALFIHKNIEPFECSFSQIVTVADRYYPCQDIFACMGDFFVAEKGEKASALPSQFDMRAS